jgi:hypothetical protein
MKFVSSAPNNEISPENCPVTCADDASVSERAAVSVMMLFLICLIILLSASLPYMFSVLSESTDNGTEFFFHKRGAPDESAVNIGFGE